MTEEVTDLKRTVQEKENDLQHLQGENKLRMEELRAAADDVANMPREQQLVNGELTRVAAERDTLTQQLRDTKVRATTTDESR